MSAFLALMFILFIAFAGSLMESASIQMAKNYRRADMNRAVESVFAEYQKELLEEFDLFAVEAGYEGGDYAEDNILSRLAYYGAGNMDHKIRRIQLLPDSGGGPFLEQAALWAEHRYGLDKVEALLGNAQLWKDQNKKGGQLKEEESLGNQELEDLLSENEASLPAEDNPLSHVTELKKSPLLSLVTPGDMEVSSGAVNEEALLSNRARNEGYGNFEDVADGMEATSLAFGVYLLEHFRCAVPEDGQKKETAHGGLSYELEYILIGKASDKDNLEGVAKKLLLLRLVPNYTYLQTDSAKKAEARALAGTLCTLLAVPVITEAVTQALLFAWAFGESVMDIRSLLGGMKVPLVKSSESWQLQLSSLSDLGGEDDKKEGRDDPGGMSYEKYLQMLLFLEGTDKTAMRGLDMIEQRLRKEKGLTWMKMDSCMVKIEISSVCSLRRGIRYRFPTYFGYK